MPHATRRTLVAIAPGARHIGYAIFRESDLIRFGVRNILANKSSESIRREVTDFLCSIGTRYRPTSLAVEDPFYAQARGSRLVQAAAQAVRHWAAREKIAVSRITPPDVKRRLCPGRKTRRELAHAVTALYPFLKPFLKVEKSARAREYWQQMFDAVALGALGNGRYLISKSRTLYDSCRDDTLFPPQS